MSEHIWVRENLASYLVGGLEPEERELLEQHTADCAPCASALEEARALDQKLEGLFAEVRPDPALEDRSIRAVREWSKRGRTVRLTWRGKALLAAAAAVVLIAAGAGLNALLDEERLSFPGAKNNLKQLAVGRGYFGILNDGINILGGAEIVDERLGVKGAEELAKELREKSYPNLRHGTTLHGQINSKSFDFAPPPFTIEDVDPSAIAPDQKIDFGGERKAEVSVPGVVNPDEPVGVEKGKGWRESSAKKPADGISNTVTYSEDGRRSASGTADGTVRLWNSNTGKWFKPEEVFGFAIQGKEHGAKGDKNEAKRPEKSLSKGESDNSGFLNGTADVKSSEGKLLSDLERAQQLREKANEGQKKGPPEPAPAPSGRKIIRSGTMEFEVDSFDVAVASLTRLVSATRGAFIDTINSEKLPNGKVRGSVVVRLPPEQLDRFVLDLRKDLAKIGDLKGQRIGSKDISKEYTDMESALRSYRTMEEGILKIMREAKGTIKDLVLAEKELGEWRTKIEKVEGELRYYAKLVALSTLTISLVEKEIRTAAAVTESERVQAGIQVEDVDKALRDALAAVAEAKGRVTKSELKQHAAGQFSAALNFEVAPEQGGPLRDRLRQLGYLVRLEIDRVQQGEGGTLPLKDGSKVKRGPTQFLVSLYNLANVEPAETRTLKLAADDVATAFGQLRAALAKARARLAVDNLNEQDRKNVTAHLDFTAARAEEGALQAALAAAGEVLSRQVNRVPESENVTTARVRFKVELVSANNIPPRETDKLALEVTDVKGTLSLFTAQVKEVGGRLVQPAAFAQTRDGQTTGHAVFAVPLGSAPGLVEQFKRLGVVRVDEVTPHPQAPTGKLAVAYLDVTLSNPGQLVPQDEGLWAQVRHGLSVSLRGLLWSVSWLIVALLFVLPWLLLIWAVLWVLRRLFRPEETPAPTTPVAAPPSGAPTAG